MPTRRTGAKTTLRKSLRGLRRGGTRCERPALGEMKDEIKEEVMDEIQQ